ncbi:hypothetical protein CXG81DRAFT_16695 [Caulochytrium protostelioides]|uniref:Uncharacterized protein n=1 Tax=Caulochytrium protostelioides TaxID=1555241 RepID=A0A4P9WXC8_9FUNG|nr:hypothetical protein CAUPRSCDRAFT_10319 [Caulochytrium protostelioides]RKP03862.1 hypothetical protein CXG81DRAFT_16695 [Caulochytrium protostelioides]|eukprot:RKP03862.1 hypothetical protein CXG81DRAFT_16695 [Caulochytrium protostelioides]
MSEQLRVLPFSRTALPHAPVELQGWHHSRIGHASALGLDGTDTPMTPSPSYALHTSLWMLPPDMSHAPASAHNADSPVTDDTFPSRLTRQCGVAALWATYHPADAPAHGYAHGHGHPLPAPHHRMACAHPEMSRHPDHACQDLDRHHDHMPHLPQIAPAADYQNPTIGAKGRAAHAQTMTATPSGPPLLGTRAVLPLASHSYDVAMNMNADALPMRRGPAAAPASAPSTAQKRRREVSSGPGHLSLGSCVPGIPATLVASLASRGLMHFPQVLTVPPLLAKRARGMHGPQVDPSGHAAHDDATSLIGTMRDASMTEDDDGTFGGMQDDPSSFCDNSIPCP